MTDFLVDHPQNIEEINLEEHFKIPTTSHTPWCLHFDGSNTENSFGARIIIFLPHKEKLEYAFQLDFEFTNNQA